MPFKASVSVPLFTRTMAITAGLLALLFVFFLIRETGHLVETQNNQNAVKEGISTHANQLEREYLKLLRTIEKSIYQEPTIDIDAIELQFDLLLSRADIIANANGAESLRQTSIYQNFNKDFEDFHSYFSEKLKQSNIDKTDLKTALSRLEKNASNYNALGLEAAKNVNQREELALGVMVGQHHTIGGLALTQALLFSLAGIALWLRSKAAEREIIRLQELALQLSEASNKAELASKGKSQFLANMSHELRTPLNGMLGMLGLLDGTTLNDEQRDYTHTARQSARHLLTLLNDVLDLSSIDAGKLSVKPEVAYLIGIFADAEDLARHLAEAKHLGLNFVIDASVPQWAVVDDTRLKQILLNLLTNAIKFSDVGVITVTVFVNQTENVIEKDEFFKLKFSVRDNGIGMDEETRDRLFQRFQQGESGTNRRFEGTGLGLEISRSLARIMQGDIAVESTKGVGSLFTVTVQLKCAESPKPTLHIASEQTSVMRKVDILVADDNSTNRKYIGMLLTKMGHSVRFAENGEQAVSQVKNAVPDVIFMDIHMPVIDGIEATKTLRCLEGSAAKVPIVALTADVWDQTKLTAIEAGMNAFLAKPIDTNALEKLLTSMFPWSGNAQSSLHIEPVTARQVVVPIISKTKRRFRAGDIAMHLNMSIVGEVCLVMGPDGLAELVAEFGQSDTGNLSQLRNALFGCHTDQLKARGHSVKGESAGVGLLSVSKVAHEIEKHGAQFDAAQCNAAIAELDAAWSAGSALLEQFGMLKAHTLSVLPSPEPVTHVDQLSNKVTSDLIQIIYSSTSTVKISEHLTAIYESCVRNNRRENITGILLLYEDRFMQLLEGPSTAVRKLFEVIRLDDRHTDVLTIIDKKIAERNVKDWSMGVCKVIQQDEINTLCAPFFGNESIDLRRMVAQGPALDILNGFSRSSN